MLSIHHVSHWSLFGLMVQHVMTAYCTIQCNWRCIASLSLLSQSCKPWMFALSLIFNDYISYCHRPLFSNHSLALSYSWLWWTCVAMAFWADFNEVTIKFNQNEIKLILGMCVFEVLSNLGWILTKEVNWKG